MPGKHIRDDEAQAIIKYYKETKSVNKVSTAFKRGYNTIIRLLAKHKIDINYFLTQEDTQHIINLYLQNESQATIRKITGFGCGTINSIVKELPQKRVTTKYGKTKSILSLDPTKEIEAYIIGLLISDGSVSQTGQITLSLHMKDIDTLQTYCRGLNLTEDNIKEFESRPEMRTVRFKNIELATSLSKYGLVHRKAKKTFLPILESNMMSHLIRGIFDGDGHVSRYATYISGSKQLTADLDKFLNFIPHYLYYQKDTDVWYIKFKGKSGRKSFLEYIYKDANNFMKRKYKSYLLFYGPPQQQC